jgi:predicted nucleotidyltransferase
MKPWISSNDQNKIIDLIRIYFPDSEIYFFGSRVSGGFKETSDLDVCLKSQSALSLSSWAKLESDFVQSDLPYKVDLVDWARISPEFQSQIERSLLKIN